MIGSPLGWIVTNWRLKLLALVLAIGLLGGVAFSENPPTFGTVPVKVNYNLSQSTDVVVVNPTTIVDVPVAGFRNDVLRYQQTTAGVTIDLTRARPGRNQVYVARPRLDVPGLTFRQSTIPISLDIQALVTHSLDIEVRTKNKAPGIAVVADRTYATCGNANDRCQVSVTGPASVVDSLKAYVDYDVPITSASTGSSPNQPIKFEENGRPIDLNRTPQTIPQIRWTPEVVTVLVTTRSGSQMKTVPVSWRVVGTQACGYQIAAVDVQPSQVMISGPVDTVSKMTSVTIDPISVSGLTASERLTRSVVTGSGVVSADPQQVVVNVSVNQAFNCAAPSAAAAAAPVPTPTPSPAATPTPTPTPT